MRCFLITGLIAAAPLWAAGTARAERTDFTLNVDVGGGLSERGPGFAGGAELAVGGISLFMRAEVGRGLATDDAGTYIGAGRAGAELSVVLGFAPRISLRSGADPAFRLGARRRYALSPAAAPAPARRAARRPLFFGLGARAGTGGFSDTRRTSAIALVRWKWAEAGASYVVAGRDRPRLKHSNALPGFFAGARYRYWHLAVAAEVGATGLVYRDERGASRSELYARAHLLFPFAL